MTKKTRNLIVAAGALVLAGGAFALTRLTGGKDDGAAAAPPAPMIEITALDVSSLRSMRVENEAGGVHLYSPDGENWLVADVPDFYRPDAEAVRTAVRKFANLRSRDVIAENPTSDNLGAFGLEAPEALVVLRDKSGAETMVEIGGTSPSGAGRYVRTAGADRIFLIPSYAAADAFATADTFRDRALPLVSPDDLVGLAYRRGGVLFAMEPRVGDHPYINLASAFDVVSPFRGRYPADDYRIREALAEDAPLPSRINAFLDGLDPDDPSLGLDARTADMIYAEDAEGNALRLLAGASAGEGSRYAVLMGTEGPVFTIDEANLAFLETDPFRFTGKFLFLGSIENMAAVTVESGADSWTMVREERGNPEDTKDDYYEVDGREVPQKDFSRVYQDFIGMMWEGVAVSEEMPREPEVRITVRHVDDGIDPMTIGFWPYDDIYYTAAAGDAPREFLMGRYQVASFLESLEELASR